ncbi:MAG: prealbumin-like fold domain-containing protein [Oscillospiraceae bacterium]|nr:prealbumin-like fold domain-containing protein [Oscillospiraceae bacterium]
MNERQVEAGGNVGGIVGRANGLVNSYDTSVRGCVNRGAVYGVGGNVGGIVGNASETVIISECLALGTARSNEGPVGGIVGIVNYRCDIGGNIAMQSAVTVEDITLDVRARTPGRDYIHRVVGRVVNTFPYNNFLHGNYANPNMIVTGSNDLLDDVYDYDHFLNPSMQDLDYPGVEVRTDDPNYGLNRMQGQNLEPCAYGPNAYNCFRAISPNNACAMNQYARYLKCVGFGAPRGVKDIAMLWDMYLDYMSPCCSRGGKVVLIGVYRAATVPAAGITYQLYRVLPDGSREPAGLGVADSNGVIEFDNLPPGEYVARIVNTGSGVRDYSIYRITVDGRYQVTVREERLA